MEAHMFATRRITLPILALAAVASCGPSKEHARADSLAVSAASEQARLTTQLAAQKDSLTRVVLQADDFIMRIDSSVSRVVGKKKKGKGSKDQLDPLAQQILNRRAVMARVDALVQRAQETANQLAKANKTNVALRAQLASDSAMIADLNVTIQRQTATIDALSSRVDSLNGVTKALGATLASLEAQHNKAFYVVGREDDLLKRGIVVREGGANLLFAHPGRTLQMSRTVDPDVFTAVDQRGTHMIPMPDSSHRYRVISRQSLDYAAVDGRDKDSFTGNLKISEPGKFWGPSRFLVIVEQ
jgi:uncharacterized coiled-coil protein SlyX